MNLEQLASQGSEAEEDLLSVVRQVLGADELLRDQPPRDFGDRSLWNAVACRNRNAVDWLEPADRLQHTQRRNRRVPQDLDNVRIVAPLRDPAPLLVPLRFESLGYFGQQRHDLRAQRRNI